MVRARTARFLVALLALIGGVISASLAQTSRSAAEQPIVVVADLEGVIGPATAHHVSRAVQEADERGAEALVLQMNTPGGLVTSMREIVSTILAAHTPVVIYVSPAGGHAASAGAYILYSAHIAAMAPGTNVGAATPVQVGGTPSLPRPAFPRDEEKDAPAEDPPPKRLAPDDPSTAKAVNDAVAYIRSLAELRGRNAEWAEQAVREAASLSASAALEQGVIEYVVADLTTLLEEIDGRVVTTPAGASALDTAGAAVERYEVGFVTKALALLSNPNVALILLTLGVYGLFFELANPGIGPGVPGAICLVLGLYALNQLPFDYAGLVLVVLGFAFMAAEAVTPAFGVLGVGGVVAFSIGAAMLIDTDVPEYQISWGVVGGLAALSGLLLVIVLGFVLRTYRSPVRTGRADLIGAQARVLDWSGESGHVWSHGERWIARGPRSFTPGEKVEIEAVEGLVLTVRSAPAA